MEDEPMGDWTLRQGDAADVLQGMSAESVQTCVTSPPYWGLRDYGVDGQLGVELTPDEYVDAMVDVFREVRRVLRDDGTLWLNLGDTYNNRTKTRTSSHQPSLNDYEDDDWKSVSARGGVRMSINDGQIKEKDLVGIPWRIAFALQKDGWYLRSDIIWHKPNPMPESVKDRPTNSHEHVFLLAKSQRYYYDADAIKEPSKRGHAGSRFHTGQTATHQLGRASDKRRDDDGTRNRRDVWTVSTKPYPEAHFATFPPELVEPCVLAGAPEGGVVLDPFCGSGTTGAVAVQHGRDFVGIDLNGDYLDLARRRIAGAMERCGELDADTAARAGGGQLGIFGEAS